MQRKKIISLIVMFLIMFASFLPKASAAGPTGAEIAQYAQKFLGVPYRFGGTTPSGFDCSGFIGYVYGNNGIQLPRTSSAQYNTGKPVSKSNLKVGDLVFFANTYKAGISHSGIYIGNNKFISATSSRGIKIDSLSSSYWGPKFAAAKRVLKDEPVAQALPQLPLGQYHDVSTGSFAYDAVKTLSEAGIISGYPQSLFKPNDSITRAQAAVMINRHLKLTTVETPSFTDVSSSTFGADAIAAVQAAGIINGFKDGTFKPNEPVTRAQMAKILENAYLSSNNVKVASVEPFNDVTSEHWAYESVLVLRASGITEGYPGNAFKPGDKTSRIEFSAFLYRAIYE